LLEAQDQLGINLTRFNNMFGFAIYKSKVVGADHAMVDVFNNWGRVR
jgi:hypothetical protein